MRNNCFISSDVPHSCGDRMSSPTVSVIIPVYAGEEFIRAAMLSVLEQTYQLTEVIVVNDGSPDDSEAAIADLLNDPRVKYLKQLNQGVAAARNAGIRASSGELIAFLDQDDLWMPEKLELQVRCFSEHPDIGLVHGNVRFVDKQGSPIREREDRWDADARMATGRCFPVLFDKNRLAMLTVCMRRACFDEIGPFREDIPGVDDYEYWLRLSRRYAFAHLDRPLALYRLHGANESLVNWLPQHVKTLQAIDGFFEQHPEARKELDRRRVGRRIHELTRLIGDDYYRRNLHTEARPFLQRALQQRPFSLAIYRKLAMGMLPTRLRTSLRWYAHKLSRARSSRHDEMAG